MAQSRPELMIMLTADLATLGIREACPAPLVALTRLAASYSLCRREGTRAWNRAMRTLTAAGQITDEVLADLVMVRQARSPELAEAVRQATAVLAREVDEAVTGEHVEAIIDALRLLRGPQVQRVCETLESLGWAGIDPSESSNPNDPRKAVQ